MGIKEVLNHIKSERKCGESCNIYKAIKNQLYITNMVCSGCEYRRGYKIDKLMRRNIKILNKKNKML